MSLFNKCESCNHPVYEHVHPNIKTRMSTNCFHKEEWVSCNCRKYVKEGSLQTDTLKFE